MSDYNWAIREYDKYIKQKYRDALKNGETKVESVMDFWLESTNKNNKSK